MKNVIGTDVKGRYKNDKLGKPTPNMQRRFTNEQEEAHGF